MLLLLRHQPAITFEVDEQKNNQQNGRGYPQGEAAAYSQADKYREGNGGGHSCEQEEILLFAEQFHGNILAERRSGIVCEPANSLLAVIVKDPASSFKRSFFL